MYWFCNYAIFSPDRNLIDFNEPLVEPEEVLEDTKWMHPKYKETIALVRALARDLASRYTEISLR